MWASYMGWPDIYIRWRGVNRAMGWWQAIQRLLDSNLGMWLDPLALSQPPPPLMGLLVICVCLICVYARCAYCGQFQCMSRLCAGLGVMGNLNVKLRCLRSRLCTLCVHELNLMPRARQMLLLWEVCSSSGGGDCWRRLRAPLGT